LSGEKARSSDLAFLLCLNFFCLQTCKLFLFVIFLLQFPFLKFFLPFGTAKILNDVWQYICVVLSAFSDGMDFGVVRADEINV